MRRLAGAGGDPDALSRAAEFGAAAGSVGNSSKHRSRSRPNPIAAPTKRGRTAAVAAERGGGRRGAWPGDLACGTHPLASWRKSVQSPKDRYDKVMDDLQMIGQRNMLCGMHVHVELPDPARRVDVMTRMLPYLPLFIALSTSSPFWQRPRDRAQGLSSGRL